MAESQVVEDEEFKFAPNQIWESLKMKDFGDGKVIDYSIIVRFKHPMSGKWMVQFTVKGTGQNLAIAGSYLMEMSEEDLLDSYKYHSMYKPPVYQVNCSGVAYIGPMTAEQDYFIGT